MDHAQESRQDLLESQTSPLPGPLTILIVDDHALVRSALSQVLTSQPEVERIVLAADYTEAERQTAQVHPEIIWLDLHIVHADSSTEIGRLRQLAPDCRIMALTDVEDEEEAFAAIMAGAQGYRSKEDVGPEEVLPMIHRLYRDEFVLRPALVAYLMQRLRRAALPLWDWDKTPSRHALIRSATSRGLAQLTAREREILQLISQGYRDREIAGGLYISEKTVQKHVHGILSKLGAQNRTEAAYLLHQ
jgi:DNA-binding NarL/FixJ family response regulator